MKIKVKRSMAGEHTRIGAGTIIDLPEADAHYWVKIGKADYVDTEVNAVEVEPIKQGKAREVAVKPQYKQQAKGKK